MPAFIAIGSKNDAAPGPGTNQLMRVAALIRLAGFIHETKL